MFTAPEPVMEFTPKQTKGAKEARSSASLGGADFVVTDEMDTPTEDPSSCGPVHSRLQREDLSSEGTRLTRAAFPSAAADDAPAPERPYCDSAAARRALKSRHDTI